MKTTIIPAQITTVEDKIIGNFTFSQVFIMVASLIVGAVLYVFIPPRLYLGSFKLMLIAFQLLLMGGLAIRFNGKIVIEWLSLYIKYLRRPRYYLFTHSQYPDTEEQAVARRSKPRNTENVKRHVPQESVKQEDFLGILNNPSVTMLFKLNKEGDIDVSVRSVKK